MSNEPDNQIHRRAEMDPNRAVIGIDGNAGFALLGENIQVGECEFVEVPAPTREKNLADQERWAATQAFRKLEARLGRRLQYYLDSSHPNHC